MSLITPPADPYAADRQALLRLIATNGDLFHVMSPALDGSSLCRGIRLLGGYVLTEYGEIASPERCMGEDRFDEVLTIPEEP